MGLRRKQRTAAFASSPIEVKAAAGGASQIGALYSYSVGAGVERALSVPTISRARDLIASMIASLDLKQYTLQWDGENYEEVHIPGESWFTRPDPRVTRNFIMANTFSDLFFYGRAFWHVRTRYASGFPASFEWLPAGSTTTTDQAGPQWFGISNQVYFNGMHVPTEDVVQFLSPINGLLYFGARAIDISIRLDTAAKRFASNEISSGMLQQVDGEPMGSDELGELAAAWATARANNAIGALNQYVKYVQFDTDPSKLQLTEGREHASLELARMANIPPYMVGIATGGMTYMNAQQARQDLYLFGAKPFISCIEETLSLDTVTPRGRHVRFDVEKYLTEFTTTEVDTAPMEGEMV
jgi:phage portal protein BeeE